MAWSYSGDPATSPKDEVRFLIGDTDPTKQQIQDAEIMYNIHLVYGSNPPPNKNFLAAAHCANTIAAKYTNSTDKSVGDLSISHSQQSKQWQVLAADLRRRATLAMVPVYVGGLSYAEKDANYQDQDMPQSAVKIDGMDKTLPIGGSIADSSGV